ncbi:hypothetical protein DWW88_16475 [Bacteroides cellulosilyticus]|nr:hypothetical protein DWW88_16475 [Bacteroides cellulosilyticus]
MVSVNSFRLFTLLRADTIFGFCKKPNRVGGKRSSFLPTFAFRPLTPPRMPFGTWRFFTYDAIYCNTPSR